MNNNLVDSSSAIIDQQSAYYDNLWLNET